MPPRVPWPRRNVPVKDFFTGQVFPIPPLPGPPPLYTGPGKKGKLRCRRRREIWSDAAEAVDALTMLYGVSFQNLPVDTMYPVGEMHSSIHDRIMRRIARRRPEHVPKPSAAARQLLGSRLDYMGDGSTVEPYDESRVSLPGAGHKAVPLESVLDSSTWDQLNQTTMLADADVVEYRRTNEPVTTYCDVLINSSEECRLAFMKRLYEGGLLGFSRNPIERVAPFFVKKKKKSRQRLVLDCRKTNQLFRKPPQPDLGAAEVYKSLQCPPDQQVYIAEADIQNCFYEVGIDAWLSQYFCFQDVPASWAREELGATRDVEGDSSLQREI